MSKRILILTHEFAPFRGGIATVAEQLARAATTLGHQVVLVAPGYEARNRREDLDLPFEVMRSGGGAYTARQLPSLLLRVLRLRRSNHDIVHAIDWPYLIALAALNKVRELPFLATAYGTEVLQLKQSRQARWLRVADPFAVPLRVGAISEFTRSLLLSSFPAVAPERVLVTPLGVDGYWFCDPPDDAPAVRAAHGISPDARIVLAVSRLEPRKGHRLLLEATRLMSASIRKRLAVVIVGCGAERHENRLRALAAESPLKVVFTGGIARDELRSWYRTANVFCLPGTDDGSGVEGFGLVYLEAAAQGLPTVACAVDAIPEVVRHGETGLLSPPGDAAALAASLTSVLEDEPARHRLGGNAREWAGTFTWERCARLTYGSPGSHASARVPSS